MSNTRDRLQEPIKFMPVMFCIAIIGILYSIYMQCHVIPMTSVPSTEIAGRIQAVIFNVIVALLVVSYIRCVLTHPGTIPDDPDGTSQWDFASEQIDAAPHEKKRSGDKRYCKWCAKYKPDRCHHCRVCRQCILKMDHHCPWIYNCVGHHNYKYFFLLLGYTVLATNFIMWTMLPTVRNSTDYDVPFVLMFALLFGETLACFVGFLVTVFFIFHVWLMAKAMTTIEFCEKSMKRAGYDSSLYDAGVHANLRAVLGDNPLLWFLPCNPPRGDGMSFVTEETRLNAFVKEGAHRKSPLSSECGDEDGPSVPQHGSGAESKVSGEQAKSTSRDKYSKVTDP